jgi:hypothetical protein
MRRALFGTLAGWLAGAAGLVAQQPMPPMSSPYANYAAPVAFPGQYYDPATYDARRAAVPAYGPMMGVPTYGPAVPVGYGSPTYGPVMIAGGLQPPGAVTPLPAPRPADAPMPGAPGMMPGPMGGPPPGAMPGAPMGPNAMNPGMAGPGPNGWWNYGNSAWDGGNAWNGGGCWGGDCGGNCGSPCSRGPCGPEGRLWVSAEVLLWWTKGQGVPPLLTNGTGAANPGILGAAGTTIAFGDKRLGEDMRAGIRTRLGFWIDECQTLGIEGSFFWLAQTNDEFCHTCTVGDVLGRPFFNTDPAVNANDAEIVCQPGVLSGGVNIRATNEFYGSDANIRRNLCCSCNSRIDIVGGFRYMHLSDSLEISESLTNLDAARGAIGEGFVVQDAFRVTNNFYGGQVGFAGEWRSGQIFFDWRTLFGMGSTVRIVTIAGSTTFLDPVVGGNPVTQPGGLLAQPSNIGQHTQADFSFVPEINANIGYAVSPNFRLFVGYTFMYWTNVARAGEQINLRVDATQLPTRTGPGVGVDPQFILRSNDFWAQGVNFGLQLRF